MKLALIAHDGKKDAMIALAGDYLPLLRLRTPIVPAQLRNNAGIVGAALAAHDSLADAR